MSATFLTELHCNRERRWENNCWLKHAGLMLNPFKWQTGHQGWNSRGIGTLCSEQSERIAQGQEYSRHRRYHLYAADQPLYFPHKSTILNSVAGLFFVFFHFQGSNPSFQYVGFPLRSPCHAIKSVADVRHINKTRSMLLSLLYGSCQVSCRPCGLLPSYP